MHIDVRGTAWALSTHQCTRGTYARGSSSASPGGGCCLRVVHLSVTHRVAETRKVTPRDMAK